jgi:hypothetical protein
VEGGGRGEGWGGGWPVLESPGYPVKKMKMLKKTTTLFKGKTLAKILFHTRRRQEL